MPRHGENIRKRKDGRWEARYPKERMTNGKTVYASVYGRTYNEVKEKRIQILQNKQEPQKCANNQTKFRDVLELWFEDNRIRLKGATEYRYLYLIKTHILPDIGETELTQINATVINMYLADKLKSGRLDGKGGLSPAYVRSIMLVINSVLQFATAKQMLAPQTTKVHMPSVAPKELQILSKAEQEKLEGILLREIDETKLGILISLYTGLRIGEICALEWDDIDLINRLLYVRHTIARVSKSNIAGKITTELVVDHPKTAASLRCIPICSKLMTVLKTRADFVSSKYVVSKDDTFVNPRTFEYRYHSLLKACDITPVNYHALRHTFATRCIEKGVDIKSLSEMLGHSNVSITLGTYVHSSMELKRAQIEKLV